jgi:hypothetical protein
VSGRGRTLRGTRRTQYDTQAARRLGRLVVGVVLVVAGLLGATSAAWAYWTSSGDGTGSATTATLHAPGTPVATHTSGTQSVGVSWAAPSGGVVPEGYYVTRVSEPGGAQVYVCGSSTTVLVPSSCTDTAIPAGSYHYLVTAVYRSWTSTSGSSNTVLISTDGTAPVVTVTSVNDTVRTFPFNSDAPVSTIGGECGMVPGDAATVTPLINGAPTAPATAICSAGSWALALSTPVTAEGSITLSATQSDAAGNLGTATPRTVNIDTIRPTLLSIVRAGAAQTVNTGPLAWTVTFSEPVSGVAAANFGLVATGLTGGPPTISAVTAASGPPGTTWTVTAATNGATAAAGSIRLDLTSSALIVDPAGNALNSGVVTGPAYGYDTVKPQVTGVTSPLANGSYKAGQVVPVTVSFSEPVIVGGPGTPQLSMATGTPMATLVDYTGGSGTSTLTFTYTVIAGNASTDLDYSSAAALALGGGAITDAATNAATLTLATPGAAGTLGANKALVIDTTAPVVTVTRVNGTAQTFPYVTTGNVTSIGGACGTVTGDLAPVTVLVDGSTVGTVNCSGGAWSLPVSWTADGTRIVSATQADLATNTGTAPARSVKVDKVAPTVIGVSATVPDGSYRQGQVIPVTVTFSEPVSVNGTPRLTLRTRPTNPTTTDVDYTSGTGTDTLTFAYTVAAGHTSADLDYNATNSLSNGTIRDVANRNAVRTLPAPGAAGSLGATKNIVIDTTVPAVSGVSAAVPDGRYGIGAVIPVTVTFTEPVVVGGPGTPQLTLATGVPVGTPVSYTSGSGTATLTFAYLVVAGNASADLNYQATTSLALGGSTITDAAGNAAALTLPTLTAGTSLGGSKALVIDTVIPTVAGVSATLADNSYRAGTVVPVTVTFSEAVVVTGIPQLTLVTGVPAATAVDYTSGSGTTALTFTYTVVGGNNAPDLDYASTAALALNDGSIKDLAGNPAVVTLAAPGTAGSLGAAKNLVIDTTPPVVTVTHVNGLARTFPYTTGANLSSIGGTCSVGPGDVATVTPRINGVGTTPATAACQPGGTWTLTLTTPQSTSGTRTVSATQGDLAGNTGTAPDQAVVLDKTPPTVNSIVRTGAPQLVNAGPLTWTVTFSEPVNGVSVGNVGLATSGLTGTPTVGSVAAIGPTPSATWTVTVGMSGVLGSDTGSVGLNLTNPGPIADAVGNPLGSGTFTGQAYTYDTSAPTVTGVSSTLADGSYRTGQVVPVTVTFSEPVTVSGTPRLTLVTGSSATTEVDLTSGSGSATLTFEYTVADGDNSADLDYAATSSLGIAGATIADAVGNAAALALPAPGSTQSLGGAKDLVIDTTPPEVAVTAMTDQTILFWSRVRASGAAESGAGPLTVYLCYGSGPSCDSSNATSTFTNVAVAADGTWLTGWSSYQLTGTWFASATQTDAAGNVGTSSVFGPFLG